MFISDVINSLLIIVELSSCNILLMYLVTSSLFSLILANDLLYHSLFIILSSNIRPLSKFEVTNFLFQIETKT